MNNEIKRKITSLTLMTIMLAGGMLVAVPSMVPAAHAANANLFVSAENSQYSNYMSGPQVIEVVVIDSDINDTDEAKGEPDVTVNGKILRMVQGVDGNWYGYFADRNMAEIADSTSHLLGTGLNFGTFCSASTTYATVSFTDTSGVAFPSNISTGVNGTNPASDITATCTFGTFVTNGTGPTGSMNVLREAKDEVAATTTVSVGQIGLNSTSAGIWPFIQLYTLNPTGNVIIQYNKGGGAQTTTLTFDTVDQFSGLVLDQAKYTRLAHVHATVTDSWLNIDPTDEDSWTFGTLGSNSSTYYQLFNENGAIAGDGVYTAGDGNIQNVTSSLMCESNCKLLLNTDVQTTGSAIVTFNDNDDSVLVGGRTITIAAADQPVTVTEQGPNSGIFGTYDESDNSVIKVAETAPRGKSASVDYNDSPLTILVGFDFATINITPTDDEWSSGEEIPISLVDPDANKNSRADEDLDVSNPDVNIIPALKTGDPFTLGDGGTTTDAMFANVTGMTDLGVGTADTSFIFTVSNNRTASGTDGWSVQTFSQRGIFSNTTAGTTVTNALYIQNVTTIDELQKSIGNTNSNAATRLYGFNFLNIDFSSITSGTVDVYLVNGTDVSLQFIQLGADQQAIQLAQNVASKSLTSINNTAVNTNLFEGQTAGTLISFLIITNSTFTEDAANDPVVLDFFSFGFTDDGLQASERVANQIIRFQLEETGDNTSTFAGSLEFIMVNQLNILTAETYSSLTPIDDEVTFIVIEDLTDEDAPRVNYNDLGADGSTTPIADQEAAPSHSGVVSFNSASYKTADTVTITLEDRDLNVDSDLIEIYTTVTGTTDPAYDAIGKGALPTFSWGDLGTLLDVTFDDQRWKTPGTSACLTSLTAAGVTDTGLGATGFTLVETGPESGIFVGDFIIPAKWCRTTSGTLATASETTTGLDIEVNYEDFRDASGEIVEVGDSAGVRANTGSVSLDRTVYPVPFGTSGDFTTASNTKTTPNGRALFPIHQTGMDTAGTTRSTAGLQSGEFLASGDLSIHVRVNDPDFDVSAAGEDAINANSTSFVGPVKISVIRGSSTVVLGHAGGPTVLKGTIDTDSTYLNGTRQFGPMTEIAPNAGIFESDIVIRYTDGPASNDCPTTTAAWTNILDSSGTDETDRFDVAAASTAGDYCIIQGDILQVEYTDPADASGDINTVTDSATFDLRNGVLQSDKSVYIIGSDMILTLIEPDLDLDNDQAETYDLDLIEWDSDAATVTMGDADGASAAFDPEPTTFRETGDSTGIFQIVIEIPEVIEGTERLERGEEIVLEYTDWGPSGSDFVGDEDEDVNLTIFTSNFGATVELDQKVYTWTDKVYITIVAPDHNFDSNLVDEVGDSDLDPIKVSTRSANLDLYKLVETGTDTGIFTGEVILIGFTHDADGDTTTGNSAGNDVVSASASGSGPTSGLLPADDDDGLTVSFEFSEDETIVGSALIRWNIGEVQWLEASYPASGTGVVRVIDPDMNLKPEAVDNFNVDVWSDSDAGGIDLTVTETNEATGIFEGTVFFTTTDESSGHRLRVAEGDTVTAEYEDNTLPNPYTTADELDISATSLIGTVVPPLERAPAANLRTVDAFGNSLSTVSVDQQVQITADLANGQDREQAFAYLVQIQDGNGVTVSLAWITGSLSAGQSFSPALSWIPTDAGEYTATAFVWESVDNPTALSPPVSTTITVQ